MGYTKWEHVYSAFKGTEQLKSLSKTSILTWYCVPQHANNNKSIKIWTQYWSSKFQKKGKLPSLHKLVCFQMAYKKGFRPEVLCYLSDKLPLKNQKLYMFLQGEPLLTRMFYTINSSPLLVSKFLHVCWQLIWVVTNSVQCF